MSPYREGGSPTERKPWNDCPGGLCNEFGACMSCREAAIRADERGRTERRIVGFLRGHSRKSERGSALLDVVADQIERGEHNEGSG